MVQARQIPGVFFLIPLLACSPGTAGWTAEVVHQGDSALFCCVGGDFQPELPGDEIAVVGAGGDVFALSQGTTGWHATSLAQLAGDMVQCLAVETSAGTTALVVVGMQEGPEDDAGVGAAYCIDPAGADPEPRALLTDSGLLHAVTAGNFAPDPGLELLVAGATGKVHMITGWDSGPLEVRVVAELPAMAKSAATLGKQALFACTNGQLLVLKPPVGDGSSWSSHVVLEAEDSLARVYTQPETDEILVCDNSGALWLGSLGAGLFEIYRSKDRLRGTVVGSWTSRPGVSQYATAGYDGRVVLIQQQGGRGPSTLATDTDKLHHLAEVRLADGPALVTCGYSGAVTLMLPTR